MHHHRNLYVSFSHPVFRLLCGTHLQNTADAYTAMYSLRSYDFHKYGTRTNPLHLLLLRQYPIPLQNHIPDSDCSPVHQMEISSLKPDSASP